jgi:hypothetical protein
MRIVYDMASGERLSSERPSRRQLKQEPTQCPQEVPRLEELTDEQSDSPDLMSVLAALDCEALIRKLED